VRSVAPSETANQKVFSFGRSNPSRDILAEPAAGGSLAAKSVTMDQESGERLAAPPTADFVSFPGVEAGGGRRSDAGADPTFLPPISEARDQGSFRSASAPPALRREHEYPDDNNYSAFPDAYDYERERKYKPFPAANSCDSNPFF
jgi:hypothetical protein